MTGSETQRRAYLAAMGVDLWLPRGEDAAEAADAAPVEIGAGWEPLREAVAAFERELISKAIQAHKSRMDAVAEALGIGRRTLNEKIVKLGLDKGALL